jgi:hypothetical protein
MRGRVHGVRQRGAGAARDRLRGTRPVAGRAGRAGHALRLRVLRVAAHQARVRLHARGLIGPGTCHPGRRRARYALTLPETKVLAFVLEAIRDAQALRAVLADAAAGDVPVLLLTAGASAASRSLVAAHSGALAAGDGAWQALASAYGVHRVGDLADVIAGLRFSEILAGTRGQPPCDLDAIVSAIVCFSALVSDLGEHIAALDVNPLICSPAGVLAVDALAIPAASDHRHR